jgi:DNA-directed RNA polymerase I, II, and III subunit RPABC3
VNVDLYPVQAGDSLSLTLVSTLNQDGSGMPVGDPGQQVYDPSVPFRSTNADDYEYVMFGKVFKYKDARRKGGSDTVNAEVFASFGGLLMHLSGTPDRLKELDVDQSLYLMIRKVS